MSALPRLRRARHDHAARLLDRLLAADERVLAVTAGPLPGVGTVLAAVTDQRVLAASHAGWSKSVPFAQITSVTTGRGVSVGLIVTIHAAGTVLALRSPTWAGRGFTAALRARIASSGSVGYALRNA